ncbi:MAG: hypothetical protein ABSH47_25355 [Bryobacteraceae bacterium]
MSLDDCLHWTGRALEENGYSVWHNANVTVGTKDPHVTVAFCGSAPFILFVIATNASAADAGREREAFERSMQRIAHRRDRDRDRR